MKIEVHETVHQKSATGDQAGEVQRGGKGFIGDQQLFQRSEEQKTQKRGAAECANQAGVGQHLQVIVVGVINKFGVIQAFVGGQDDGEGAQSGAGPGVIGKDMP